MNVLMVRTKVKAENAADVEAAVKSMFSAIHREQVKGVHYSSCVLADGVTYVALLQIDDGVDNPLPALPEFREFQENLKGWMTESPTVEQLTVVGSYRLF